MALWNDHEMSVIIWEFIHHHKRISALIENEIFFILLQQWFFTKDTPLLFLSQDIIHSPWRPEMFHFIHSWGRIPYLPPVRGGWGKMEPLFRNGWSLYLIRVHGMKLKSHRCRQSHPLIIRSILSPCSRLKGNGDISSEKLRDQLQIKVEIILPWIWCLFDPKAQR